MKLWRTLTLLISAAAFASLGYLFSHRLVYPYDLEWMEGGMLCHALRLIHHQPIYAPPSVDFVPYLYTPLYPAVVALLSKGFGLGYVLGRAVSLVSFAAALLLGYVYARREGGSRATAFAAMALPAAAFVPTGAWYDLARPDSLFLGLVTAGLLIGWWGRRSHAGVAMAAALLVAAFFAKQTATPFMLALGGALLFANWRVLPTYIATLAALGLPLLWRLNQHTNGWFWTYVFRLHQQHDFFPLRAFVGTPARLCLLLGPALLIVPWALARRASPGLVYATWIAGAGIAAACVGFGTQWAFVNAFIPGIFFPAIAIGVGAGRLLSASPLPRHRPAVVYCMLALALICAPGGLVALAARVAPRAWTIDTDTATGYDPRPYVPTVRDRVAGDKLVARLRAAKGDVLIPFHPFYAHLAGKRTFLHRMGVLDVTRAGLGMPVGLVDAIGHQRFSLAIFDNKIDGNWAMWPGLLEHYRVVEYLAGPRVVSGAPTEPRYLLTPIVSNGAVVPTPVGTPPVTAPGIPPRLHPGLIDKELQ